MNKDPQLIETIPTCHAQRVQEPSLSGLWFGKLLFLWLSEPETSNLGHLDPLGYRQEAVEAQEVQGLGNSEISWRQVDPQLWKVRRHQQGSWKLAGSLIYKLRLWGCIVNNTGFGIC